MAISNYSSLLKKSHSDLTALACKKIDGNSTLEEILYLPNAMISLWSIFEVTLAIHIFPSSSRSSRYFLVRKVAYLVRIFFKKMRQRKNKPQNKIDIPSGRKIYFLGFSQYLAEENFDLIFQKLLCDGVYAPTMITDDACKYDSVKKSVLNIKDLKTKQIQEQTSNVRRDIKGIFSRLRSVTKSLRPKDDILLKIIPFIELRSLHEIAFLISCASYLLKKHPPAALVSVDVADPRARVFTLMANKLNIPVIQIQAGPIDDQCIEWKFCSDDMILTHGELGKSAVFSHGVSKEKIFAVGSSKHERLVSLNRNNLVDFRQRYQLKKESTVIVLLSTYLGLFSTSPDMKIQSEIFFEMYEVLLRSIGKRDDLTLIIKPHVLDAKNKRRSKLEKGNNVLFANSYENTQILVASADAVISFGSTATIDAFILGKPTAFLSFEHWMGTDHLKSTFGEQYLLKGPNELDLFLDSLEHKWKTKCEGDVNPHEAYLSGVTTNKGVGSVDRIVSKLYEIADV